MVSTRPLISMSSWLFINPLMTVPRAPITVDITFTFMFRGFFFSVLLPGLRTYVSFHFHSVSSSGQSEWQSPLFCRFSFLLTITQPDHLSEIRWSVCISKSQRILVFHLLGQTGSYIHHLSVWSNSNFLHNSLWISFPTQSCLDLYSFCANSLHSLFMWSIVTSLSPRNLQLLFCCVLSLLVLVLNKKLIETIQLLDKRILL